MSTVLWIGRVRRGTELRGSELNTMREAGLDCRLFFDTATAERFITHHASSHQRRPISATSSSAGSPLVTNPIFAVVAAEGTAVSMFENPEIATILLEQGIHSYAVVSKALSSELIGDGNQNPTAENDPSSGGLLHADPNSNNALTMVRSSSLYDDAGLGRTNSMPLPEFVRMGSNLQVQEEIVAQFTSRLGEGKENTDSGNTSVMARVASAQSPLLLTSSSLGGGGRASSSTSIPASQNDQRYLSSMVSLVVPPPEGIPSDSTFLGEGPVGSFWRHIDYSAAEEDTYQGTRQNLSKGVATAIRVLPEELMAEPYYSILDAQMKLKHPNITGPLRIDGDPTKEGKPRFIYSHCFHAHLERSFLAECVPEPVLLTALFSVLQAAREAHRNDLVMRDVTSYIVVFDHDNVIRVSSNYFVPMTHRDAYPKWMITAYCAPETIALNEVSPLSDIWGIGMLTLRMVCSVNPWQKLGEKTILEHSVTLMNLVSSLRSDDGESGDEPKSKKRELKQLLKQHFLQHIPAGTNPGVVDLITKCLSPDPTARPSVDELLASDIFTCCTAQLPLKAGERQNDVSATAGTAAPCGSEGLSRDQGRLVETRDDELNSASAQVVPLRKDSQEYSDVRDAVGRALLKQHDATQGFVELVGAARVENRILRQRFQSKLSAVGNSTVGFHGAPAALVPSVLRYGVLRSGHRLNPTDMSKWEERGSIGSTKLGVYLAKYPGEAIKYTSREGLPIGSTCDVVMFEVALGDARMLGADSGSQRKYFSDAEINADSHHSFVGENEMYLREEVQLNPTYLIRLRTVAPTIHQGLTSKSSQGGATNSRFHIMMHRSLGKGSFGSVKLAIQYPRGKPVAVKIFDVKAAEERYCRAEFETLVKLREFRHIMKVIHYEIKDGVAYMFMELLSTSILDLIQGFGPMEEEVVISYMIQAAQGLESLRLEGLVHRDVKPANMMLAYDGTLKLTDFGLSPQVVIDASKRGHNSPTAADGRLGSPSMFPVGSPAYWSPELINGVDHSPESDVWALAASMVHMLTGTTPMKKELGTRVCTEALAYALGSHACKPEVPTHVTPTLKRILEKCFSANPEDRPPLVVLANPETYVQALLDHRESSSETIVLSATSPSPATQSSASGGATHSISAGDITNSIAFSHGGTTGVINYWDESGMGMNSNVAVQEGQQEQQPGVAGGS